MVKLIKIVLNGGSIVFKIGVSIWNKNFKGFFKKLSFKILSEKTGSTSSKTSTIKIKDN